MCMRAESASSDSACLQAVRRLCGGALWASRLGGSDGGGVDDGGGEGGADKLSSTGTDSLRYSEDAGSLSRVSWRFP
jgi:hypothetical protein